MELAVEIRNSYKQNIEPSIEKKKKTNSKVNSLLWLKNTNEHKKHPSSFTSYKSGQTGKSSGPQQISKSGKTKHR